MDRFPPGTDPADLNGHGHEEEDWAETLARSVAHLAAQLTVNQRPAVHAALDGVVIQITPVGLRFIFDQAISHRRQPLAADVHG